MEITKLKTSTNTYWRYIKGVIVCYDVTDKQSFVSVKQWLNEIEENAPSKAISLIVGCKSDLSETREVNSEEGQVRKNFYSPHSFLIYILTI